MKDDDDDWLDDSASADDLSSVPPEVRERVIHQLREKLAAETAPRDPPASAASHDGRRGAPGAPFPWPEGAPPPTQRWTTLRSPAVGEGAGQEERGAALAAANDVAQPRPPAVPMPPVVQAPVFLVSTAPVQDLTTAAWAKRGELPFGPASPGQPAPKRAVKTVQSPVLGLEPGKTTPLGDDSIAKAVAAVLPFRVPVPPLTARQYASLRAELELWPARAGEILSRYQVRGDVERAALDAYWSREHAARPEARAAFEADVASYRALLHAQRASPF